MRIFLKYAYVLTRGGGYCERRQSTGLARAAADIRGRTYVSITLTKPGLQNNAILLKFIEF
jgi:hypothetical protein